MNFYRAKPSNFPWPPILILAAILISVLLGLLYAPGLPGTPIVRLLGGGLAVAAVYLVVWAIVTLIAAQTTILPHRQSSHLVTDGPFNMSRNPIYLGQLMLVTGLGFLTSNGWFLIFAILAGVGIQKLAVVREESHLLARFGAEYEFYCRRVRRWV